MSINKLKLKIIIISILDDFDKKYLSILVIKANLSIFANQKVYITIIGINVYCSNYKSKRVQFFVILIKDLKDLIDKKN